MQQRSAQAEAQEREAVHAKVSDLHLISTPLLLYSTPILLHCCSIDSTFALLCSTVTQRFLDLSAKELVEATLDGMRQSVVEGKAKIEKLESEVRECEAKIAAADAQTEVIRAEGKAAEGGHVSAVEAIQGEKRAVEVEMAHLRGLATAAEVDKRSAEQAAQRARAAVTGEAGRRAAAEQRAAAAEAAVVLTEAATATVEKELVLATQRWEVRFCIQNDELCIKT